MCSKIAAASLRTMITSPVAVSIPCTPPLLLTQLVLESPRTDSAQLLKLKADLEAAKVIEAEKAAAEASKAAEAAKAAEQAGKADKALLPQSDSTGTGGSVARPIAQEAPAKATPQDQTGARIDLWKRQHAVAAAAAAAAVDVSDAAAQEAKVAAMPEMVRGHR